MMKYSENLGAMYYGTLLMISKKPASDGIQTLSTSLEGQRINH